MFSCEYSKSFRNSFFIEQLWWLLLNYVLVLERIFKKESYWRDCLNTRAYKQVNHHSSICLAKFAEFYYHKYLKQEVNDDLSICVDKRSPCDLSITGDIKIYQWHVIKGNEVTTPIGEVPYRLLSQSCFYCPNLITVVPL